MRGMILNMKIGLALAGGGVKGAGHLGVIKALEENGIEIDTLEEQVLEV